MPQAQRGSNPNTILFYTSLDQNTLLSSFGLLFFTNTVHKTTYETAKVIINLKQLQFSTLLFKYIFSTHTSIHCGYDYSHLIKHVILKS